MIDEGDITCKNAPLTEIITGQLIEKRKMQVSSALKFYKKSGWQIPYYAEKLILEGNKFAADNLILEFIADSKLSKDEIIKKYRLYLKKTRIKNFVKAIVSRCIKPFKKK